MLAEKEPDPNELPPAEISLDYAAYIYESHLKGVATRDIGEIISSVHEIQRFDNPFAASVAKSSYKLTDKLMVPNARHKHLAISAALRDSIRAYIYSEVEFDPVVVHLVTQMTNNDQYWLRNVLRPSNEIAGKFESGELRSVRRYGYLALRKLDIQPRRSRIKAWYNDKLS